MTTQTWSILNLKHVLGILMLNVSTATLRNSLYDTYKMAIRWASDRIDKQGVIAFVTNGSWIDGNVDSGSARVWQRSSVQFMSCTCGGMQEHLVNVGVPKGEMCLVAVHAHPSLS